MSITIVFYMQAYGFSLSTIVPVFKQHARTECLPEQGAVFVEGLGSLVSCYQQSVNNCSL